MEALGRRESEEGGGKHAVGAGRRKLNGGQTGANGSTLSGWEPSRAVAISGCVRAFMGVQSPVPTGKHLKVSVGRAAFHRRQAVGSNRASILPSSGDSCLGVKSPLDSEKNAACPESIPNIPVIFHLRGFLFYFNILS